ncbi:unnamed protein product, partial [Brenthis ino]
MLCLKNNEVRTLLEKTGNNVQSADSHGRLKAAQNGLYLNLLEENKDNADDENYDLDIQYQNWLDDELSNFNDDDTED